ncbi:hypothetical protein OH77DRAFT_1428905 [Trametes cingulata]|nr:hypothetical protein OH77DRAFT_1428905 [Trametes cingulata]
MISERSITRLQEDVLFDSLSFGSQVMCCRIKRSDDTYNSGPGRELNPGPPPNAVKP